MWDRVYYRHVLTATLYCTVIRLFSIEKETNIYRISVFALRC